MNIICRLTTFNSSISHPGDDKITVFICDVSCFAIHSIRSYESIFSSDNSISILRNGHILVEYLCPNHTLVPKKTKQKDV